jgi:hypothetical protein
MATLAVLLLVAVAGCSSDDSPKAELGPTEWKASVYETVLRDVALGPAHRSMPETEKPVLYLATADGSGIGVEVQALVAKATKDEADLQFADDVNDIVLDDEPGSPVKDDGLLVTVSPLPDQSDHVELTVRLYFSEFDDTTVEVTMNWVSTHWTVDTASSAG